MKVVLLGFGDKNLDQFNFMSEKNSDIKLVSESRYMRFYSVLLLLVFFCSCSNQEPIRLNNQIERFDKFPNTDSLFFESLSEKVMEEPSAMLFYKDNLIIETFCKGKDNFLLVYSLTQDSVLCESIKYGNGPNEMLSCKMSILNDRIWLYDMSKMYLSNVHIDSLFYSNVNIQNKKIEGGMYYRTAMLNDSILIGTGNMANDHKVDYININTNKIINSIDYAFLNQQFNRDVLIDVSHCDIKVNPKTKDILLSYRFTDVIEIYSSSGELISSYQGPLGFDLEFQAVQMGDKSFAAKTKQTRKAYVNSYVTEKYIYLLYSGCRRNDTNWENGTELFVFSWDGKPYKRYILNQPIYTLAVDEKAGNIYSYSLRTGEIIKGKI